MNIKQNSCPACGSLNIHEVVHAPAYPAILFPIESEKRSTVATASLTGMGCAACDHIFLVDIDAVFNQQLYSQYYYLYPYSNLESMGDTYRKPFERIFRFFADVNGGQGKKLLEIGCSSPAQLELFSAAGFSCTGISPGASEAHSECLIDGFYEATPFATQFDQIVSRFNLEHIIDLDFFLNKVYSELKDGGLFFVQVPNVRCFLAGGMVGFFAHEHPHYFSRNSLSLVLERTGFKIELVQADVSDPSIIVVAKKIGASLLNVDRAKRNLSFASTVISLMSDHRDASFVFYGAGMSLCTLLYVDRRIAEFEGRLHVVDDNPLLEKRYMPNTQLEISSLKSMVDPCEAILFVFLNSIYHERVLPRVKALGFRKIFYLNGAGVQECS